MVLFTILVIWYNVAPLLTDVIRQTPGDSPPSHECCHSAPHVHDAYIFFFFTLLADHCENIYSMCNQFSNRHLDLNPIRTGTVFEERVSLRGSGCSPSPPPPVYSFVFRPRLLKFCIQLKERKIYHRIACEHALSLYQSSFSFIFNSSYIHNYWN